MLTHALTCTGPYAVLIMLGIKRMENQGTMPAASKGRCAASCSKTFCKEDALLPKLTSGELEVGKIIA